MDVDQMWARFTAAAGAVLLSCVGCSSTHPSTPAAKATEQVVIRPVDGAGRPAPGFSVTPGQDIAVSCAGSAPIAAASPVAVDSGIAYCSPSAAYAVACWPASSAGSVLCFQDPWTRRLVRLSESGAFPSVAKPAHVVPLGLLLDDGAHCQVRDGGAWSALVDHPDWSGMYQCGADGAVWGPAGGDGIDVSSAAWTVQVAAMTGTGPVTSHHVLSAYFVGTSVS